MKAEAQTILSHAIKHMITRPGSISRKDVRSATDWLQLHILNHPELPKQLEDQPANPGHKARERKAYPKIAKGIRSKGATVQSEDFGFSQDEMFPPPKGEVVCSFCGEAVELISATEGKILDWNLRDNIKAHPLLAGRLINDQKSIHFQRMVIACSNCALRVAVKPKGEDRKVQAVKWPESEG